MQISARLCGRAVEKTTYRPASLISTSPTLYQVGFTAVAVAVAPDSGALPVDAGIGDPVAVAGSDRDVLIGLAGPSWQVGLSPQTQ